MGFRLPQVVKAKKLLQRSLTNSSQAASSIVTYIPKGYLAVYVEREMKRFVIPVSFLNQRSFQELLSQSEQEFGFEHPMGGLTIPCREDSFVDIVSHLNSSS